MLTYIEPVFRPPSEWRSLILQVTNGCSWNRCRFCEMYTQPQKRFSFKSLEELEQDLLRAKNSTLQFQKIFLADGDALTLSSRRLEQRLMLVGRHFPEVQRVSSYCLPRNIRSKSVAELKRLRDLGLSLVYVGCESGDDEVLRAIDKGETYLSQRDALLKLHTAGIKTSVMILNGLAGTRLSQQHARHSAWLMNETQPDYLSTLVISFPLGMERFKQGFDGQFEMLDQRGLFAEMKLFLSELVLQHTVFRSDHASNYLVLKGRLGRDKQRLMREVDGAIAGTAGVPLREEWQRGL